VTRTAYGDCIGCKQPIRPPYLSFAVMRLDQPPGEDPTIQNYDEVDVCGDCAKKLTAEDLHRLVSEEETVG